jgi:BirA family transcriptional regulator, biotin operon repressor / biotin---[acetyl-CoA-carboxylase] ligase
LSQSFNTLSIGKVFIQKDVCTSTNDECKLLLSKNKPAEGTAIITDYQTHGRGQFGNDWHSEKGLNLMISFIVYPSFLAAEEQFFLSKIVSLACVKTCEEATGSHFSIKWPNDIYCQQLKTGGILIENQLAGNKLASSVWGIGLNLNQTDFSHLPRATSLAVISKKLIDKNETVRMLCENLDALYLTLRQRNFGLIDEMYHGKMMSIHAIQKFRDTEGAEFTATVAGTNKSGQLRLLRNGHEKLYNFKEVEWLF